MAEKFLEALATAATTENAARNLLDAAGLDVALVARWDLNHSPRVNWTAILEEVQSVAGEDGVEALRQAAAVRYPAAFVGAREHELTQALEQALADEEDLASRGEDTVPTRERIVDLKRRMRDHGLTPGYVLADRYRLVEKIGSGGFATVWKAFDRSARATVACKILHRQYAEDRTRRERFLRGARQMAKLDHPAIVRVMREPEMDGPHPFFVMEYLSGGDLRQAVCGKKISRGDALARVLEVAEALAYAHARGVIHRDVKPANLLLTGDGRAKLTDFDLVRAADTTGGTRTQGLGSFLYAAPEMMELAKEAGEPADVYGLAMTGAFVLHGGDLPATVLRDPSFVSRLEGSDRVCSVLAEGVAWEISERLASMEVFQEKLRAALASPVVEAPAIVGARDGHRVLPADLFSSIETPVDGRVPLWSEIPAGTFLMGSPDDEEGRGDDEEQHEVTISQPFQMMAVPVTNAMYRAFDPDFEPRTWEDTDFAELAFHPVVDVSWHDAQRFGSWLAKFLPGVRLPTEAEWEYACRARTSTRFWSGNTTRDLQRVGWYSACSSRRTHRVGEKAANPWNLYDVHGNVWEWCSDWYGSYGKDPVVDPAGPGVGVDRVYRGGSWYSFARYVQAAYRIRWPPWRCDGGLGFRLARGQASLKVQGA